jgi:hypothetical protein
MSTLEPTEKNARFIFSAIFRTDPENVPGVVSHSALETIRDMLEQDCDFNQMYRFFNWFKDFEPQHYLNRMRYGVVYTDDEGSYRQYQVFPSSISPEEAIEQSPFYAYYSGPGQRFSNGPVAYTKGSRTIVKNYSALDI